MQKNKSKTEVILISQFPLPYAKIASWTTMYNYLLEKDVFGFDHIICPKVEKEAKNVSYQFLREATISDKVKTKLINSNCRYNNYLEAINNIIESGKKYILHIVDNSGIVVPIHSYLMEKYDRNNFYIQYYYQGFAPLFSRKKGQIFLSAIDEIFFLTNLAYMEYLNYYDDCTFKARVVHNATDSKKFKVINASLKNKYREEQGLSKYSTIFMWCSQDRPKKGLHIVLEAFNKVYTENNNVHLLIVGVDSEINQDGVTVMGRVPNHELPKYYQMTDVYLFPSLWKEGFGIVLAEALKCGCYCIASRQGGIPEVLNYGEYGVLIENPNFVDDWIFEMKKSIEILEMQGGNPLVEAVLENIYDLEDWTIKINLYIEEAKLSLNM